MRKVAGAKFEGMITSFIMMQVVGNCIALQIAICSLTQSIFVSLGFDSEMIYAPEMKLFIMMAIGLVLIFPLCLLRNLSVFRYVSLAILFSMFYVCIVLLIELPDYFTHNYSPLVINYATFNWNFFPAFATTVFSYSCHVSLINIYDEMSEPSTTGGF